MNLSLRPVAELAVTTRSNSVLLKTTQCQLYGDAQIEALNDRFCMLFDTTLTWSAPASQNGAASAGFIQADGALDVWCEVVPPFGVLPRPVLEGACNAVMRTLLDSLLPMFVEQLAADYAKWAADPAYRAMRAKRSVPLV